MLDVKEDLDFGMIMVRTEPGKTKEALAGLEAVHSELNPDYPVVYQFVDQEYDQLYQNEKVITNFRVYLQDSPF